MKETVTFDDILLVPQYSEVMSRKSISIASSLGEHNFELPIISSPMDTITDSMMSAAMGAAGGLGIIHRYNTIDEQCKHVECLPQDCPVGAAIGVTGDYLERAKELVEAGVNILCVDVAHGHHALTRHAIKSLRKSLGDIHIMAGNVATLEGFNDLSDWGADSIRVGIGGGSICSTRIQTGHGVPTLQSIMDCSVSDRPAALIADGGIKTPGDIVKALAAGADFVILGSMLAGTMETPGDWVYNNGERYKTYRGMASVEAQIDWRGHTSSVEGVSHIVPHKGPVKDILKSLSNSIRSGLSYSGALNLGELRSKTKLIKQTSAGLLESNTHIKTRY